MAGNGIRWRNHLVWIGALGVLAAAMLLVRSAGSGDPPRRQKRRAKKDWGPQPTRIHGAGFSMPVPAGFHTPTGALAERERKRKLTSVYADDAAPDGGDGGFVSARVLTPGHLVRPVHPAITENPDQYCALVYGGALTQIRLPVGPACQKRSRFEPRSGFDSLTTKLEHPRQSSTLEIICFMHREDRQGWKACETVLYGIRWE